MSVDTSQSADSRRDSIGEGEQSTFFEWHGEPGARKFVMVAAHATREVTEQPGKPFLETGSIGFDALFALAVEEAAENSVSEIRAHAFNRGAPIKLDAFETGQMWQYVWTRDVSYATDLGLASLDVQRCLRSLMYKTSRLKNGVEGGHQPQILQDTGSGGSYPVSTDRVVWALAAERALHFLNDDEQHAWLERALPIVCNTIEQDRKLIFDPAVGLYRGEESFLDWREQSYPTWTIDNTLTIAMSPSLSTNVGHYFALTIAAQWEHRAGHTQTADQYAKWAADLKVALNDRFYDEEHRMYAAYLLADGAGYTRVHQYELLGQALAIIAGIADPERAWTVLTHYPTGPSGPPVIWPQDPTVHIYHNHAIWPFVTAYWIKAARIAGHDAVVSRGVDSLVRASALFLSNMENLDLVSGHLEGTAHGLSGPPINSRRQLWSVAGYLSMVQDSIFGMETTERGIRFSPVLPSEVRNDFFSDVNSIHLREFRYRGKRIDIELRLPEPCDACELRPDRIELNGQPISSDFVAANDLLEHNRWTIHLVARKPERASSVVIIRDFADKPMYFGPPTPQWRDQGNEPPVAIVNGRVRLRFGVADHDAMEFNVFRNGECIARRIIGREWIDESPIAEPLPLREYVIEAVWPGSKLFSRLSPVWRLGHSVTAALPTDLLDSEVEPIAFQIDRPGQYELRFNYANANGTINTGLTCAVKRLDVLNDRDESIASGFVILPQTGGVGIWQWSSGTKIDVSSSGRFRARLSNDPVARNMSYFEHNQAYTDHEGGGPEPFNSARIKGLQITLMG